jgi:hypothetical protein
MRLRRVGLRAADVIGLFWMPRPPVKWPGAEREDRTPFERFRDLLGQVIDVPKAKILERDARARNEGHSPKTTGIRRRSPR